MGSHSFWRVKWRSTLRFLVDRCLKILLKSSLLWQVLEFSRLILLEKDTFYACSLKDELLFGKSFEEYIEMVMKGRGVLPHSPQSYHSIDFSSIIFCVRSVCPLLLSTSTAGLSVHLKPFTSKKPSSQWRFAPPLGGGQLLTFAPA